MSALALAESIPEAAPPARAPRRLAVKLHVRYGDGSRAILFQDGEGNLYALAWALDLHTMPPIALAVLPAEGSA